MRLMDSVVKRAMDNKDLRKGTCLEVADFAFGFGLYNFSSWKISN